MVGKKKLSERCANPRPGRAANCAIQGSYDESVPKVVSAVEIVSLVPYPHARRSALPSNWGAIPLGHLTKWPPACLHVELLVEPLVQLLVGLLVEIKMFLFILQVTQKSPSQRPALDTTRTPRTPTNRELC